MKLHLGIKSDPIQKRYSYEWLFTIMKRLGIQYLQLGGFLELPLLEDDFFYRLREKAGKKDIKQAVEQLYEVKVAKITVLITPKGTKKAFVKLNPEFKASDVAIKLGIL